MNWKSPLIRPTNGFLIERWSILKACRWMISRNSRQRFLRRRVNFVTRGTVSWHETPLRQPEGLGVSSWQRQITYFSRSPSAVSAFGAKKRIKHTRGSFFFYVPLTNLSNAVRQTFLETWLLCFPGSTLNPHFTPHIRQSRICQLLGPLEFSSSSGRASLSTDFKNWQGVSGKSSQF